MKDWFRKRNYFLVGGSFLMVLYLYLTDPNGGTMTAIFLQQLATPVIAVWFAYLARKALFDYIDMETLYERAKESTIGAAIIFASLCLVLFGLLGLFGSNAKAEGIIPQKAAIYLPIVKAEQQALWVDHPKNLF